MNLKTTLLSFLLLGCITTYGQQNSLPNSLNVAYIGQYSFEPGIKVGFQSHIQHWESEKETNYTIFLSPQVGVFTRPGKNTSSLFNFESGVRRQKTDKKTYSSFGLSLGYLLQNELLSFGVDLATGDKINKERELYQAILPMVNYEFGKDVSSKIAWYLKLSAGHKFYFNRDNALTFFLEVGTRFNLKSNQKTSSND